MGEPGSEETNVPNGVVTHEDGGAGSPEIRGADTQEGGKGDVEVKSLEEEKAEGETKESEKKEDEGDGGVGNEAEVVVEEEKEEDDVAMSGDEDVGVAEADGVKLEEKASEEGAEVEEDSEEREEDSVMEEDSGDVEKKDKDQARVETPKRKRSRGRKPGKEGDKKAEKESKTKTKGSPKTPAPRTIGRPTRERRTVERLVEVIEKGPNKSFLIEKGRGTPLKDIPNVAYKLSKRRSADLKLLHQTLFGGRRGKALDFKSHILQFSGFPWPEDDEKQLGRVKEKLDKYVKDSLLDMCDLLDIHVSRTSTKKEDLVLKLVDFMMEPHPTTDVILADKDQSSKSGKRKRGARGTASKSARGMSAKRSRKINGGPSSAKAKSAEGTEDEDEENDSENSYSDKDEKPKHSDSEDNGNESDVPPEYTDNSRKSKRVIKKTPKGVGSVKKQKIKGESSPMKAPTETAMSPSKSPSSKYNLAETNDNGEKVFSRKKKTVDTNTKKHSNKQENTEKSAGKRVAPKKGKSEDAKQSGPSKEDLRKTICEILKEVDFNTATFTDILKKLDKHYKMDLAPRKKAIKVMIQDELTKLANEDEENEEDEEEEDAAGKGHDSKSNEKSPEA